MAHPSRRPGRGEGQIGTTVTVGRGMPRLIWGAGLGMVGMILPLALVLALVLVSGGLGGPAGLLAVGAPVVAALGVTVLTTLAGTWIGYGLGWRLHLESVYHTGPHPYQRIWVMVFLLCPPLLTGMGSWTLLRLLGVTNGTLLWMAGVVLVALHATLPLTALAFDWGWRRLDLHELSQARAMGWEPAIIMRTLVYTPMARLWFPIGGLALTRACGEVMVLLWIYANLLDETAQMAALASPQTLGLLGLLCLGASTLMVITKGWALGFMPVSAQRIPPFVYDLQWTPPPADRLDEEDGPADADAPGEPGEEPVGDGGRAGEEDLDEQWEGDADRLDGGTGQDPMEPFTPAHQPAPVAPTFAPTFADQERPALGKRTASPFLRIRDAGEGQG